MFVTFTAAIIPYQTGQKHDKIDADEVPASVFFLKHYYLPERAFDTLTVQSVGRKRYGINLIVAAHTTAVIGISCVVFVIVVEHAELSVRVIIAQIRSGGYIRVFGILVVLVCNNKRIQSVVVKVFMIPSNNAAIGGCFLP